MYPLNLTMNSLPSPPETNITLGPAPLGPQHRQAHSILAGHDNASVAYAPSIGDSTSTPVSRLRRQPSIVYHSPNHRMDARERAPSGSAKLLVVVVPPASLLEEHGTFGSTLSVGPLHRLSQGIIMPLFPNMYGQLSAIAKEFNFPSINGLCLYYCYNDSGIVTTPRVSEDTWSTIWGLSDALASAREKRPTIAGKLEFDIDYNHARWYNSWLTSRIRDSVDYPMHHGTTSAPSQQNHNHHNGSGSRFTFPQREREPSDDFSEPVQQRSAPVSRHVPRKLSLVDRFDNNSVQGTENSGTLLPVLNPQTARTGPVSSHILSPIKQLDEPKSARLELDHKVNTWRAAAIASPEPIEEVATLEPATAPETGSPSEASFHLSHYQFSISSHGPDDRSSVFCESEYRTPSVHLCDRVNGSVASTASYCTSPGPSDSSVFYAPSAYSYPYSPDIAHRMYEDAPMTPLTATSWGAPSFYTESVSNESYQASIDLALRACFSRPSTPGTATSWGPPSDYGDYVPESPRSSFSVHLGDRGDFSRPVTPQTATSWGASSCPDSPMSPYRLPTPDIAHRTFEDVAQMVLDRWPGRPWRHAWPYNVKRAGESQPSNQWAPIISKVIQKTRAASAQTGSSIPTRGYPFFDLYPVVETVQPTKSEPSAQKSEKDMAQVVLQQWPGPWRHAWPYNIKPAKEANRWVPTISKVIKRTNVAVARERIAPSTQLDGYPHNLSQIYKAQPSVQTGEVAHILTSGQYPFFDLYPAVYPFNLERVYPNVNVASPAPQDVSSESNAVHYPFFELYPAVYPFNLDGIYPVVSGSASPPAASVVEIQSHTVQYPFFVLYPSVYPYNVERIYPVVAGALAPQETQAGNVALSIVHYPFFDLYPAVYPFNLEHIYPTIAGTSSPTTTTKVEVSQPSNAQYPFFDLYPAVYPFNVERIYLHVAASNSSLTQELSPVVVAISNHYPFIEIYPAVYPFNVQEIYPSAPGESIRQSNVATSITTANNTGYPCFDLYHAVYPFFNLYPVTAGEIRSPSYDLSQEKVDHPELASYPYFAIYPAVYPHFDLYPSVAAATPALMRRSPVSVSFASSYPYLVLYPAVYPHFDLWPSIQSAPSYPEAPVSVKSLPNLRTSATILPSPRSSVLRRSPIPRSSATPSPTLRSSLTERPPLQPLNIPLPPIPVASPPAEVSKPPANQTSETPSSVRTPRVSTLPTGNKRRSGRLTHAELHAMVMMGQSASGHKLWMGDVLESFPPVPSLARSTSTRSPSRSPISGGSKADNFEATSLSRSSSVNLPQRSPLTGGRNGRISAFPPSPAQRETLNRSLSLSDSNKTSMAQRRSMWEGITSVPPPPTRQVRPITMVRGEPTKRRDSIVLQRAKVYAPQTGATVVSIAESRAL